jgi:hypothetical protein
MKEYNTNIDKLLDLGKDLIGEVNYEELGLNIDDSENLLKVIANDDMHYSIKDIKHPYAPIHAIYALVSFKVLDCFDEVSNIASKYSDRYIADAILAYDRELNLTDEEPEEILEEVVEEIKVEAKVEEIVEEPIKELIVEEKKEEIVEEQEEKEEVIVLQSDEIIKEAIDEMEKDKPRQPKGRPPVKEPVKEIKVGRNDPCPCGSGKKYKKCCINL